MCESVCLCVSLDGCQCEQLSPDVTCISAHCGDFPQHFPHHLEHKHLPPSICPILACRTPSAAPRSPASAAYHFQGPGTEWFAEWLLTPAAGSSDFYLPAFGSHTLLEISFQACCPARGLRAIPPGRSSSCLRCGPGRVASAAFCSLLPKSCPRSRAAGSEVWKEALELVEWAALCSWRERAQDWAELWPPGFSLLCGLAQDTY